MFFKMNAFKMLLTAEAGTGEVETVVPDVTIDWSSLLNTVVNWVLSTGIKIVIKIKDFLPTVERYSRPIISDRRDIMNYVYIINV